MSLVFDGLGVFAGWVTIVPNYTFSDTPLDVSIHIKFSNWFYVWAFKNHYFPKTIK